MSAENLTAHPLADLVPAMTPAEYGALVEDIRAHGLQQPVVLCDGKILDGRHRYRACRELGIDPKTTTYNGASPVAFVLSANLQRRHLSSSQKAILAADALPHFEAEAKERQQEHGGTAPGRTNTSGKNSGSEAGEAREHAAKAFGVNPRYVQDAKTIASTNPELADEVRAGKTTINKAIGQVKRDGRRSEAQARVVDLVGTGVEVHRADFREHMASMPEASVDLILTDVPFTKEHLPLFADLGPSAKRVLKPDGSLVVMVGNLYCVELANAVGPHFKRRWPLAYLLPGATMLEHSHRIRQGWKPVWWFTNRSPQVGDQYIHDVVTSDAPDKAFHEWGQSVSGFSRLVELFSKPGDVILDPFCGSGTTLVAAAKLGRQAIGIDIDESCVAMTRSRVADAMKAEEAA